MLALGGTSWLCESGADSHALVSSCASVPIPVIAWVDGSCWEEGLELALACDIRIGSAQTTLRMGQVLEGRMPECGGTQRLPRLAGPTLANRMILLGEEVGADEAVEHGLLSEQAGDPQARAIEVATVIASQGPIAERFAKEAIDRGLEMPLEQALRYETDLTVILQSTRDRAEGVSAFLEKRDPRFRGQ